MKSEGDDREIEREKERVKYVKPLQEKKFTINKACDANTIE